VTDFGVDLQPLAGGMSGETWLTEYAGERAVVRIYGGRSLRRGPRASEVDAAVLAWLAGLLPVPQVLDVRRGDPGADLPALLVTSYLPGVLLADLKPTLDDAGLSRVGQALGTLLGRLAHVAMPRAGLFRDPDLGIDPMPEVMRDLTVWTEHAVPDLTGWDEADLLALRSLAAEAQGLLDGAVLRTCLVHSDLNPKNVLVDPATLEVTGLLDWEFAHAGSPYADLGNLLRHDREPAFADAVLAAREAFVPDPRSDALDLARASDLFALVDLATRREENPVTARADALLHKVARTADLHAWGIPDDIPGR
jgi:aminoglycoside phosphotransferase (APT) family kinase protein